MDQNRYVLDTNIWISYFLNGELLQFSKALSRKKIELFTSKLVIEEITDVIHQKKIAKHLIGLLKEYIDFHEAICTIVGPPKVFFNGLPDPDENFLIDLAIEAKVPHIVTGDKKLLLVSKVAEVQFVSMNFFNTKLQ